MKISDLTIADETKAAFFVHTSGVPAEKVIEFASKAEKEKLFPVLREAVNSWMEVAQDEAYNIGRRVGFRNGIIVGGIIVGTGMVGGIIYASKKSKDEIEE